MKNNLLLLLSLIALVQSTFAQELPEIAFPSPTAFELTKYGNMSIDESSGKVQASIPLYTYNSGKLSLPINLSYSGGGVKVDQLSSWTGINWNLQAGGVISRVVKDKPDERGNRTFFTWDELEDAVDAEEQLGNLNLLESSGAADTQADLFSFSFPHYSGSFYLDDSLQPQLANYDKELYIEFIGGVQNISYQEIVITDPAGVKYYFGGYGFTEQTRIFNGSNSNDSGNPPTTSYYINRIEGPYGDIISFHYENEPPEYNIAISFSEVYTELRNEPGDYDGGTITNKILNGKYLSKITSNRSDLEVHFNSTMVANNNYRRFLNNVEVKKKIGTSISDIKKFSFIYLYKYSLANSSRFFLEEVGFYNDQSDLEYKYLLEYNDPTGLSERLSHSKDFLGFFNGKSNSSSLPQNSHPDLQSISGANLGDRSPVFAKAVKGTLSKIIYPTGGNTSFIYEAPQFSNVLMASKSLGAYSNLSEMNPYAFPVPDTKLTGSANTLDLQSMPHPENQVVTLFLDIKAKENSNLNHFYKVHITVDDGNSLPQTATVSLDNGVYNYDREFNFNFVGGHFYEVSLELELPPGITESTSAPIDVKAAIHYANGYQTVDGIGLRIKKVTNDPIKGPSTIKRYYYQDIQNIGTLNALPFGNDYSAGFVTSTKYYKIIQTGNFLDDVETTLLTLKSERFYDIFPNNEQFYKYVTTSFGGDNFENGGIERDYRYANDSYGINLLRAMGESNDNNSAETYSTQKENLNIYNGKLLREQYFKNENGNLFLVKDITNTYSPYNISEGIINLALQRIYDRANQPSTSLDGLYIGAFNTYSQRFNQLSRKVIDYTTAVPLADLIIADTYPNVVSLEEFEYGKYVGLPSVKKVFIKDSTKVIEVRNFYPGDVTAASDLGYDNLTTQELNAVQTLDDQHRLSEPVQVETKVLKDSVEVSKSVQRTSYKDSGYGEIVPEKIETAKGSGSLHDRIIFHSYDNYGNPIRISKANGPSLVYIWGYNKNYPVAKVENATYAEVTALINSSVINNPTNDTAMRTELNKIRTGLPNALVTTYTFDRVRGVTSVTDPKGYSSYFEYDEFNRLKLVKDAEGKILKENLYHFKNNNL